MTEGNERDYYTNIFNTIESTVFEIGSQNIPLKEIHKNLVPYTQLEGKSFSDDEYYRKLVHIIFYAGFKASTVTKKLAVLQKYFPTFSVVAQYGDDMLTKILTDPDMIKNEKKVRACVHNAQVFIKIIQEYGSLQNYIDSFRALESFENLMLLKETIEYLFDQIGETTTYHFLMDSGLPVLKPDRVLLRLFKRLGLIEDEKQLLKTILQGRKFSQFTKHHIRYIDIIFVVYGQVSSEEFGILKGICLGKNPRCEICKVKAYCRYFGRR